MSSYYTDVQLHGFRLVNVSVFLVFYKSPDNISLDHGPKFFPPYSIKASRISGCLNETIWSIKYLRNEAKVRIYKSIVRPILTYAAETRTDTAKTMQMLEVTEMNTLRRITNKTKWDRARNDRIRESCEIQNITSWVQRRRTEWSKHISRMADDRLVRKVRDGIPEGKRNRGRPMKRWRDALE